MTNILHFQSAALVLGLCIFIIILRQKRIGIFTESLVFANVIVCGIVHVFDLAFRVMLIRNIDYPFIIDFLCTSYLAFAVGVTLFTALMLCVDCLPNRRHNLEAFIFGILSIAFYAIIYFLGVDCGIADNKIIVSGLGSVVAHFAIIVICVLTVLTIVINRNRTNTFVLTGVIIWSFLLASGTVLNYFLPGVPCLSFSLTISLFVAIAIAANIENHFNNETSSFNYESFYTYLNTRYDKKESISLIYLYSSNEYGDDRKNSEIKKAIDSVVLALSFKFSAKVFRVQTNELIICSSNLDAVNEYCTQIKEYIDEYQTKIDLVSRFYSVLIKVDDITIADSAAELTDLLSQFRNKVNNNIFDLPFIVFDEEYKNKINAEYSFFEDLDYALDNNKVLLNLLPVYNVVSSKYRIFEIVPKIELKDGRIIDHKQFLDVLERYGGFLSFCGVMLSKACNIYNEYKKQNLGLTSFLISFTAKQLEDNDLINLIIDAVVKNNIDANAMGIKIVNPDSNVRLNDVIKNIQKLQTVGVQIISFGFCASVFRMNASILGACDVIIFDYDFIDELQKGGKENILFDDMISLLHELGKRLGIENVDTKEQFDNFIEKKIDFLSGSYIGSAMNQSDFVTFINDKKGETK